MDSGGWLGVMKGVSCLVAVLAAAANIPTRYWMPAQRATLQYLADAPLDDMESKRQLKVQTQASKFVKIHGSKLLLLSLRAGSKTIFVVALF